MSEVRLLEPGQIFDEMDAQPPLMRQEVATTYLGSEVEWQLMYRNAYELSSGRVHLLFSVKPFMVRMIVGDVILADHPQLRYLPTGATVRVRGIVRGIDTLQIELEIHTLQFLQSEASQIVPPG